MARESVSSTTARTVRLELGGFVFDGGDQPADIGVGLQQIHGHRDDGERNFMGAETALLPERHDAVTDAVCTFQGAVDNWAAFYLTTIPSPATGHVQK